MNRFFKQKTDYLILFFCLFLAAIFIFDHIGKLAFWLDEAAVALVISHKFSDLLQKSIIDVHPIFYIVSIKLWSRMFGNTEIALRSFSSLFGLLTIVLVYKVGRYVFATKRVGIWAAIFASTNYFLIWFSTQTRPYTMAASFGLLSFYFFLKSVNELRTRDCIIYIIVTSVGIYTHNWLFLVFGSQVLCILLFIHFRLKGLKKLLLSFFSVIVLTIPNVLIIMKQNHFITNLWVDPVGLSTVWQSFIYLTYGSSIIYIIVFLTPFYISIRKILMNIVHTQNKVISLNQLIIFKGNIYKNTIPIITLLFYLLFPILTLLIISQFKPLYVAGRHEMIVLPAFILLAAGVWSRFSNKFTSFFLCLLLIIFALRSVISDREVVNNYKATDKTIIKELLAQAKPHDVIIATDLSWATLKYYSAYFDRKNNKEISFVSFPKETMIHPGWKKKYDVLIDGDVITKEIDTLIEQLEKAKKTYNSTIWILYRIQNPINEILYKKLQPQFTLGKVEFPESPREPSWFDVVLIYH